VSEDQNLLGRDLQRLVRVDWSATRAHRTELGLAGRRRRRKITRAAALATAALGVLAFAAWPSHDEPIASPPEPSVASVANVTTSVKDPAPPPAPTEVRLSHGGTPTPPPSTEVRFSASATAVPIAHDAKLRVVGETKARIVVALDTGGARFDIARTADQAFRLVAPRPHGDIKIDVVAAHAQFAVVRETRRVHIEVYDGLLNVTSGDGVRELGTGASYDLPTSAAPVAVPPVVVAKDVKRDVVVAVPQEPAPVIVEPARDVFDDLLLAADRERKAGNHDAAVELLRQGLRDHAGDARAPLAAFTLGRVLLQSKRPAEASEAFATAARLAPNGPLAQDAVARQVEALAAAGNASEARTVAQAYVTRFPDGRRLAEVRVWGGL
jgi:transmembrane sensor